MQEIAIIETAVPPILFFFEEYTPGVHNGVIGNRQGYQEDN
jgi:hypothetical protein